MIIKFPCKICCNSFARNHHAIQCDKYHIWAHTKCSKINLQTYNFLPKRRLAWYSIECIEDVIPFSILTNQDSYKQVKINLTPNLSFFQQNKSSLPSHKEKLSTIICEQNLNFDFLGLTKN